LKKDPFDRYRQLSDKWNQALAPLQNIQRQINRTTNFKSIAQQLAQVQQGLDHNFRPLAHQLALFQQSLNQNKQPVLDALRIQESAIGATLSDFSIRYAAINSGLNATIRNFTEQYQSALTQVSELQILSSVIPSNLYPRISEVASAIAYILPEDDQEEDLSPVTSGTQSNNIIWTWDMLFQFLALVMNLLSNFYLADQTSKQLERHHLEDQTEQRKQTSLLEIQIDIERQKLEVEQERLEIERERNERERRIEIVLTDCLESISECLFDSGTLQPSIEDDLKIE